MQLWLPVSVVRAVV